MLMTARLSRDEVVVQRNDFADDNDNDNYDDADADDDYGDGKGGQLTALVNLPSSQLV